MAYLVEREVIHCSDPNRYQSKASRFEDTQWYICPTRIRTRMKIPELLIIFGQSPKRDMQFTDLQKMLKIALKKFDHFDGDHSFQISYINCVSHLITTFAEDIKLSKYKSSAPVPVNNPTTESVLNTVKNVVKGLLKDLTTNGVDQQEPSMNLIKREEFNEELADTVINNYIGRFADDFNSDIDHFNILNDIIKEKTEVTPILNKDQWCQTWLIYMNKMSIFILQERDTDKKQRLLYYFRFARVMFAYQSSISSTMHLERTFSLLILSLQKRRNRLGPRQHEAEGRIMTFFRMIPTIREILGGAVFPTDVKRKLTNQFKMIVPDEWIPIKNNNDEEYSELDSEMDDNESDGSPRVIEVQTFEEKNSFHVEDQSSKTSGRSGSQSSKTSGRSGSLSSKTSGSQKENLLPSNDNSINDKSINDKSIDIYNASRDRILQPSGNGLNYSNNPVRYIFVTKFNDILFL